MFTNHRIETRQVSMTGNNVGETGIDFYAKKRRKEEDQLWIQGVTEIIEGRRLEGED